MNSITETMVGKILEPVFQTLPPDAARRIVDLEADEQLQVQIVALAQKSN